MKTLLFYISDIHYTGSKPENEGLVIKGFIEDLKKQLNSIDHDDAYVLIGGDLVQAADNYSFYEGFYKDLLEPIIKCGINTSHIISVPGNHDIQRDFVLQNRDVYMPVIKQNLDERRFNNILEGTNSSILTGKFQNYKNFVTETLQHTNDNLTGFPVELNDNWSLYCLNSSLTSSAGIKDTDYPGIENDAHRLNIDTRNLYDWVKNNGKKKILMLHHPIDFLTDWAALELKKIIKLHFDLVLTGHTHEQDILCNSNHSDSFVWCMSPQLYTNKTDKLGYCIIQIDDTDIEKIIYREWFTKRNAFRQGLDFTEEENGIITFEKKNKSTVDPVIEKIKYEFGKTMSIYGNQPEFWVERYFSKDRFDHSYFLNNINLLSETNLIDAKKNYKIITPAQYGLTSFAWHFIYRLWSEKKEFALYIDCGLIRKKSVEKSLRNQLEPFGLELSDIKWVIYDNWSVSNKDAKQILTDTLDLLPDITILLLCPILEETFLEINMDSASEFNFENLYMAPLQKAQIRTMVNAYNKKSNIGVNNEVVLKRLDDDIQNFNMHRTPLNCITLLEVFSNSFDDNPVNRTAVIERILRIIFDNEDVPNYKSLPDVKDCEFVLGYFCEQMIRNEEFYFSDKDFNSILYEFCNNQKITLDINYLFSILLNNNIICQYDVNTYSFRFAYWVYYFAAMRMTKSEDFATFILQKENYAHYPEVIEFYTGSDRARDNAAKIVIEDLDRLTSIVHDKIGIPENLNPFSKLKINISEEQVEKAVKQLDTNLQKTKLPEEIKDALADKKYNPSLPYQQKVYKVFENYSINYLQELISISSKVLRNSDYIDPINKTNLINAISKAWFNTIRAVYLMAPALAKDGIAGYDGFRLRLTSDFDLTEIDRKHLFLQIIVSIPQNIVSWYKDDFYSAKLTGLIFDKIENEANPVIKHVLICLIINEMPIGWHPVVRKYLSSIDSKSYYYGDTIDTLKDMYANGIMSDSDLQKVKNLIYLAYTKLYSNDNRLRSGNTKYLNKDILPERFGGEEHEEIS